MIDTPNAPSRHRIYEDVIAILFGTMLVSLGLTLYTKATLISGSTAGLALIIQYATGMGFGPLFFVINLPFFALAWLRMGWQFTLKSFVSVALVSVLTTYTAQWLELGTVNPYYAAIAGGAMLGMGVLALFRHRASVGGINILALYLQDNFGIRAGYFQLAVDLCILATAFFVVPFDRVLISMLGAACLNLFVAINHRPGRYVGFS